MEIILETVDDGQYDYWTEGVDEMYSQVQSFFLD